MLLAFYLLVTTFVQMIGKNLTFIRKVAAEVKLSKWVFLARNKNISTSLPLSWTKLCFSL